MGNPPDGEETVEQEFERRIMTWALPVADRILDKIFMEKRLGFPPAILTNGPTARDSLAFWLGGVVAQFVAGALYEAMPRPLKESGQATLVFVRDESSNLTASYDGAAQPRFNITEGLDQMFRDSDLPSKLNVIMAEEVEQAILDGRAFLPMFEFQSTGPDGARYVWKAEPEELAGAVAEFRQQDETEAFFETERVKRVERLKAKIAVLPPLLQDLSRFGAGATIDDLEAVAYPFAHQLVTFMLDARLEKEEIVLRTDGSVSGAVEIPARYVLDRLAEDIAYVNEQRPERKPIMIAPAAFIAWVIGAGAHVSDVLDEVRLTPIDGGLLATWTPAPIDRN